LTITEKLNRTIFFHQTQLYTRISKEVKVYIQHLNQKMHLTKYYSWQVPNSYIFRHRSAILRVS